MQRQQWLRLIPSLLPLLAMVLLVLRAGGKVVRLGMVLRIDALALVLLCALLLGLSLLCAGLTSAPLRTAVVGLGLALGYMAASIPLLLAGFFCATIAAFSPTQERRAVALAGLAPWLWSLLPPLCLAAGLGWLGLRAGAWSFESAQLPVALDSICFVLLLAAAALGMGLAPVSQVSQVGATVDLLLRPAWIYPLARLYELSPWNHGWVLATALLGGVAALWSGWSAPWSLDRGTRAAKIQAAGLGGALAALGLTTEAGLAGALLGILSAVVVGAGLHLRRRHPLLWLIVVPAPLTLPFVALWLQIGAAAAGGLVLLAAGLWLGGIGAAVAGLRTLSEGPPDQAGWSLWLLAALSLLAGIAAPLLVRLLVRPALIQLGGGITAFGSATPSPWLGLEVRGSGGVLVTTWLSVAIVGLLLALVAIVYLLSRLLLPLFASDGEEQPALAPTGLWATVRGNLPWLAEKDEQREL